MVLGPRSIKAGAARSVDVALVPFVPICRWPARSPGITTSPISRSDIQACATYAQRVHAHACRTSDPDRSGCVLDCGRRPRRHGRLVRRDRHLLCISWQCSGRPKCNSPTRIASPNCVRRSTASWAARDETRINDEAVDPQRFLRAGLRLGNI